MTETETFKRCNWIRKVFFAAATAGLFFSLPSFAKGELQAEISSQEVSDGAVLRVTAHLTRDQMASVKRVTGKFEDTEFLFFPAGDANDGTYAALVGVPHHHAPGTGEIRISAGDLEKSLSFKIVDAKYPSETLKVKARLVNPRKKDLIEIKRDVEEVGKIYSNITEQKFWNGPFVLPIDSAVTSVYGTKRLFNGKMQSYHNGLDLKAPMGTPIHAAGPGVVVLAKKLFFTGNTVLIDHGYGVVTLYAHMSKLSVKLGDRVGAGQLLGLSGMTGRANGPHLHWGVVINKVKVNPAEFIKVAK